MRSFVSASAIANRLCSPSRDGQEILPQLVDKLITASINKEAIRQQRFPHDDQIYLHGPDGILVIDDDQKHEFVPSGLSIWEMGTSMDPKTKADDDFSAAEKKLAAAFSDMNSPVVPSMATFVFVTSKSWESGEWVKEKKATNKWKNIKVIDAVTLEKWISQNPAVMLWFAEECNLPAEGLYDAEQYIRNFGVNFGLPQISPELILAGREDNIDKIQNLIFKDAGDAYVQGESIEVVASLLAAVSLINNISEIKKSTLVFADSRANLKVLATLNTDITLIPLDCGALKQAKNIPGHKWRLIIPGIEAAYVNDLKSNEIVISRCKRDAVEKYLVKTQKFDEHKAAQIVRETKGSLIALLWLIGSGPIGRQEWASQKDATTHASLILAGSWSGANQIDFKIVERLSKKDYREVETLLQSTTLPEGPWIHQGREWSCACREYVWGKLAGKITDTMLDDFVGIVNEVVGEQNPALDLPLSDRYLAAIKGKTRKYSNSLRQGLVDSIVRLALNRNDGQSRVDNLVHGLIDPERANAIERWLSLTDVYSALAEAAPTVFLNSVETMVRASDGKQFFQDGDGNSSLFNPTSPHVYLLWALERLAWQNNYLPRVLCILAKLAEIDPGGNTSNRPKASIGTILQPWMPQHRETVSNTVHLIERLYSISPEITWGVSLTLLPRSHDILFPTPVPTYLEHEGRKQVTNEEYCEFSHSLVVMLIKWADCNGSRWASLIDAYPEMNRYDPALGKLIAGALIQDKLLLIPQDEKVKIYTAIRTLISQHRGHPNTEWSLKNVDLTLLDDLLNRFIPTDLVRQSNHLFSWNPQPVDALMEKYGEEWDNLIANRQIQAVIAIFKQEGLSGIYRLAEAVDNPEMIGPALAQISLTDQEVAELFQKGLSFCLDIKEKKPLAKMTQSYVWKKFSEGGEEWLEKVIFIKQVVWSNEMYANMALAIPASPSLWNRVEWWGSVVEKLYWENIGIYNNFYEHWPLVLKKWKEVSRPWSSLEYMARLVNEVITPKLVDKPSAEQVIDILEQVLQAEHGETLRSNNIKYEVEQLFSFLDAKDADKTKMARLEWGWLSILTHTKRGPRILQHEIITSPELFIQLLNAAYFAEDESRDQKISEDQKYLGKQAYKLLDEIKIIPGYQTDESGGKVDQNKLCDWVNGARKLATENKRLKVCDAIIGKILSYSPTSTDGSWPCVEVRNLLEVIQSQKLENGLCIGRYNQRGVIMRDVGGKQERDLANVYRVLAEKVRIHWPRTAAMLDSIAKNYEGEAKFHDEQAKIEEYE